MSETATVTADLSGIPNEPGVPKPDPILVVDDVRRSFGGLVAVDVDHLEIQRGIITALIGPNGAGKTTLFNVLSGFDDADRGRWEFEGERISGLSAYRIAQKGMVRTFQLTKALHRMRVIENMKLGATGQRGERFLSALIPNSWRSQEGDVEHRADDLLERFQLLDKRHEYAGELSGGQRKLLEMARALMVQPSLLLLDEPMAGVNPALTQSLLTHVQALRDEGMSIVFVEHDMDVVMGISDWVVCMAEGKIISEGVPEAVGKDPAVIDAYLGETHDEPADVESAVIDSYLEDDERQGGAPDG